MTESNGHGEMRITSITVGDRHRRAMGDIDALAESIKANGLLRPIVVNARGELIAGARRLEACKQLGWTWVPARVVDLDDPLQAELDENTARKDFTPTEIAAIARAMREREEEAARERQREHAGTAPGKPADITSANFAGVSDPDAGRVISKIAARTGRHGWARRHVAELGGYREAYGRLRFPVHAVITWQQRMAAEYAEASRGAS